MHSLVSSQLTAGPPMQAPFEQRSAVVHAFPSLQATALFVWRQPSTASQVSIVQRFPSSHPSCVPARHAPFAQTSAIVQALPSSHGTVLATCAHPLAGAHESSVHAFPSLQLVADPPTQAPCEQVVPVVHGFPSSQEPPSPATTATVAAGKDGQPATAAVTW